MWRYPISKPDLRGDEERFVNIAMRSSWISSTGDFIDRFESRFAKLCDAPYALGVCNGTAALHLALLALDVRPGDEVLVPALTYVAVANACRYVGAIPVFVDVDPATWCIDPMQLERAVTPRTRGVIAVHSYGHPAEMSKINRMAAVHGLWVVEDAAEAHFAECEGAPVGGLGRIGVFSFYGNKIITSGEGGAVVTHDPQLAVRLKTLRGQGVDPDRRYYFPVVGYNFRMTNVQAAILCAQLDRYRDILTDRRRVRVRYMLNLKDAPVGFQPCAQWAKSVPWMFCLTTPRRDEVMNTLGRERIETRPFFIPLHLLPPYRNGWKEGQFPHSEDLGLYGFNLPTYPELTDADVDAISEAVLSSLA